MTTATFTKMASVTASTKRPPTIAGGKSGTPVTHIASLKCTKLISSNAEEWRQTFQLGTLTNILDCFVQGDLDIVAGDILVVGSVEYPVRAVIPIPFGGDVRRQLVLEGLKR